MQVSLDPPPRLVGRPDDSGPGGGQLGAGLGVGDGLYSITTTSNSIEHTTTFDDGRIHATFTQTGTFVAVPLEDPSLPSYTGKFTVWGGFNQNGTTVNGTFTMSVRGKGSDGSTFRNHVTDHFNQRPDGTVNAFFHCH